MPNSLYATLTSLLKLYSRPRPTVFSALLTATGLLFSSRWMLVLRLIQSVTGFCRMALNTALAVLVGSDLNFALNFIFLVIEVCLCVVAVIHLFSYNWCTSGAYSTCVWNVNKSLIFSLISHDICYLFTALQTYLNHLTRNSGTRLTPRGVPGSKIIRNRPQSVGSLSNRNKQLIQLRTRTEKNF